MVQWLGLWASSAVGEGLTPGRETRITHGCAALQKEKKSQNLGLHIFSLHLAQWMNEAQVDLQGSRTYTMPLDQFSAKSPIDWHSIIHAE